MLAIKWILSLSQVAWVISDRWERGGVTEILPGVKWRIEQTGTVAHQ